jgi:hypothetical protein
MSELLPAIAVVAVYFAAMRWVLPYFGIGT